MIPELLFGTFPNFGFVNTLVPDDVFDSIKKETDQESINFQCAGTPISVKSTEFKIILGKRLIIFLI